MGWCATLGDDPDVLRGREHRADAPRGLPESSSAICPGEHRVLVVDDASPDGTGRLARRLAAELPAIEVLQRHGKQGLGRAYLAGFEHALRGGAELVIVMDADFSHDPAYLPELMRPSPTATWCSDSRYVAGGAIVDWPPLRRAAQPRGVTVCANDPGRRRA